MEIKEIASRTRKELLGEVAHLFTLSVKMGVKQVDVSFIKLWNTSASFFFFLMALLAHQSVSSLVHLPVILSHQGLTEEPSGKSDSGTVKQRKMSKKNTEDEPKARVLTSTNSDR